MQKDLRKVDRVKTLRAKGKSFREIARLLKANVRQVYRWHVYSIDNNTEKTPSA